MMPVLFIGHGSPMNAIEDNEFTENWKKIASQIPKPKSILVVSAHWVTGKTSVSTLEQPKTIHDFYGFPKELFDMEYRAKGAKETAVRTLELLEASAVEDNNWGLDHGAWSILHVMYPNADIPVFQVSINGKATPHELFETGKKLKELRKENVLIVGSGNVVHNLGMMDFSIINGSKWARDFDDFIQQNIEKRDFESILNYKNMGTMAALSVPTTEHLNPLFYVLGATESTDELQVYNKAYYAGGLSMTCYVFS